MLKAFGNIFKVPDLRNKVLFTLMILFVYRIGAYIPTPGIDGMALAKFFESISRTPGGTLFGLMGMFSGGALEKATIFALGIMPYISASIILQLLTVVIPHLEKLAKEGEEGRKKIVGGAPENNIIIVKREKKIFVVECVANILVPDVRRKAGIVQKNAKNTTGQKDILDING